MRGGPSLENCREASKGLNGCFCLPEVNKDLAGTLPAGSQARILAFIGGCQTIAMDPANPQPSAHVKSILDPSSCPRIDPDQCSDAMDKIPDILAAGPANAGACAKARKDLKMCLCLRSTLEGVLGGPNAGLRAFAERCENTFKIPLGLAGDRACSKFTLSELLLLD